MDKIKHIETYCSGCGRMLVATSDEITSVLQTQAEEHFTIAFNCPWCKKRTNTVFLELKKKVI